MARIRVLVVDDSSVVRKIVGDTIAGDAAFELVGTAADGRLALEQIERLHPDVVTLDIEMPNMDGVEAAREIHARWPKLPVIMFSTLSQRGATATLEALGAGAVDYVTKPTNSASLQDAMQGLRDDLFAKLKLHGGRVVPTSGVPAPDHAPIAHEKRGGFRVPSAPVWDDARRGSFRARLAKLGSAPAPKLPAPTAPTHGAPAAGAPPAAPSGTLPRTRISAADSPAVVVIGVSTGGPPALNVLLPALPAGFSLPILIVQHMPPLFTKLLAQQLATKCALKVVEAEAGMVLEAGVIYIAPGDWHMVIDGATAQPHIALHQEPPENSCRPAVDPLFRSAAKTYGRRVLGVVLTGMGSDGLKGSQAIKEAGGRIVAQDEKSSVVWGMPGFVANKGVAERVLPLDQIAAEILCRVPVRPLPPKVPVPS